MPFILIKSSPKKNLKKILENIVCDLYNFFQLKKNVIIHIRKFNRPPYNDNGEYIYLFRDEDEYCGHHITINRNLFELKKTRLILRTIAHEFYHCYQNEKKIPLCEKNAYSSENKLYRKVLRIHYTSLKNVLCS